MFYSEEILTICLDNSDLKKHLKSLNEKIEDAEKKFSKMISLHRFEMDEIKTKNEDKIGEMLKVKDTRNLVLHYEINELQSELDVSNNNNAKKEEMIEKMENNNTMLQWRIDDTENEVIDLKKILTKKDELIYDIEERAKRQLECIAEMKREQEERLAALNAAKFSPANFFSLQNKVSV